MINRRQIMAGASSAAALTALQAPAETSPEAPASSPTPTLPPSITDKVTAALDDVESYVRRMRGLIAFYKKVEHDDEIPEETKSYFADCVARDTWQLATGLKWAAEFPHWEADALLSETCAKRRGAGDPVEGDARQPAPPEQTESLIVFHEEVSVEAGRLDRLIRAAHAAETDPGQRPKPTARECGG